MAGDEVKGRVAQDAVAQLQAFQLLQVRSCPLQPRVRQAVRPRKAQRPQAAAGGDVEEVEVGESGDVVELEALQARGGGSTEPRRGDFAATQLQSDEGWGEAVVRQRTEVGFSEGEELEARAARGQGGEQSWGQQAASGGGTQSATEPQGAEVVAQAVPKCGPESPAAELGGGRK